MGDRQGVDPDRRWEGTGRSERRDYHNWGVLCEKKKLFTIKEKILYTINELILFLKINS